MYAILFLFTVDNLHFDAGLKQSNNVIVLNVNVQVAIASLMPLSNVFVVRRHCTVEFNILPAHNYLLKCIQITCNPSVFFLFFF